MFIDTHCHIFSEQFDNELDEIVLKAIKSDVKKIIMPNISLQSIDRMKAVAEKFPDVCLPSLAIHPCDVSTQFLTDCAIIKQELKLNKYVAIGETGIDLYWDKSLLNEQKKSFQFHLQLAKEFELPVLIHIRDSFDEVFEVIEQEKSELLKGIFHCFTGTQEQAERAINLGFLLGIGGVITFKNSQLPTVLKNIDLKNLVLETDSPYLAPTPYRGKRNEPAYIPIIAEKIADIKQCSIIDVADLTTENAKELFKI